MIGQTVSHYRIVEKLGEGGMGVVYIGEDTHLGRRVAIKFPANSADEHHFRARFLREARAVSVLSHPHIAAIYDYGETGANENSEAQPFIVMELVKGPSLEDLMHREDLILRRAVEIVIDVAEALSEAHSHGIIHRDIKPSNVLLNERNEVKVLDFGLAKQLKEDHAASADPDARTLLATRTRSGVVVGTPLYLSPEQAKGTEIDGRSDLFALGALLYECVTGRPAFSGSGVLEIAGQVLHVDPPPPSSINPSVPEELDRITMKALAKKPDERYQTAQEMLVDLRAALEVVDESGTQRTRRIVAPSTEHTSALATLSETLRRPRLSLGLFLILIAVAVLAIWTLTRRARSVAYKPSAEAQRWYDTGTNALRDGAYYQASKALEQAINLDENFALARARLAEALMELDYVDRAKDELLRVSALTPDRTVLPQLDALYLDAVTSTVRRDFPQAVKAYEEIARLSPNEAQVYVDLGRAFENNEEQKKAIESYIKATNLNQQYATAYLRVGVLYGRQQDQPSAAAVFDKAEALYQALGNIEGRAEVYFQRGFFLRNMGKIAEARPHLQRALDLARAASNPSQQIKTLLQLSYVAFSEGNTNQAHAHAREAVDLAQANGMENLTARGFVDLGNVFFVKGDYAEAENYFRKALEFAQRNKGRRNEARALLMLGSLRQQQGQANEVVRFVEQALPFYQQGGYRKEASQALLLLGYANLQRGDYEAALRAFEQQLQLAQQVNDPSQIAYSHEGIGTVLTRQERYPEALNHYEQKYVLSKSTNDQKGMAYGLVNRAYVFAQLGRYEEARVALEQAAALANRPDGGMKALLAEIPQVEAEMALSQRRFPVAKTRAKQALALAGTQYTDVALGAKRVFAMAQVFSGSTLEAKLSGEQAVEMATRSGNPLQLAGAQLAHAHALLENRDAQGAQSLALRAQEFFARGGQRESEWRTWLVAALASRRAGDETKAREYALNASHALSSLKEKWGGESFETYLARPDVQHYSKQLKEEFTPID